MKSPVAGIKTRFYRRWMLLLLLIWQMCTSAALNAQSGQLEGAGADQAMSLASDVVETAVADLSFLLSLYDGGSLNARLQRQLKDDYFPMFDATVISNQVLRGFASAVERTRREYLGCLSGLTFFNAHLDVIAAENNASKSFAVEPADTSVNQPDVARVRVVISRGEDKFQLAYRLVKRTVDVAGQNTAWRIVDIVGGSGSLLSSMRDRIKEVHNRAVSLDADPYVQVKQALLDDNEDKQIDISQWCPPVADNNPRAPSADTADEADRNDIYEVNTTFGGKAQELYVEVTPDGTVLYQDDIILGTNGDVEQAISGLDFRRLQLWSDATVPYVIDDTIADRALVLRAMQEWADKTPVRFIAAGASHKNILILTDGDGCRSSIGMLGGRQYITLDSQCSYGAVLHEIGHTLGLIHEHNRDIRDQYISVKLRNVLHDKERNFYKHPPGHPVSDAYCYGSIMHYSEYAFSMSPQLKTIEVKGRSLIGQRKQLSACDVGRVRKLYKPLAGADAREAGEDDPANSKK